MEDGDDEYSVPTAGLLTPFVRSSPVQLSHTNDASKYDKESTGDDKHKKSTDNDVDKGYDTKDIVGNNGKETYTEQLTSDSESEDEYAQSRAFMYAQSVYGTQNEQQQQTSSDGILNGKIGMN